MINLYYCFFLKFLNSSHSQPTVFFLPKSSDSQSPLHVKNHSGECVKILVPRHTPNNHSKTSGEWGGSPGGPVVKNPPCNAGGAGSILSPGTKIPHATEQLSLHAL